MSKTNRLMTKFFLSLGLIGLSACAYNAQVVRLDPLLPEQSAAPSTAMKNIWLRIRDMRPSKEIGHRSDNPDATITSDPDAGDVLKSKVAQILQAKGWRAVDSEVPDSLTLAVDLKELSYTVFTEDQTRKVKIRAILKIVAQKGPERLEKSFEANQERKIPFEPVAKSNEEWINDTFSDVLKEFAGDERLFTFLAEVER
jgi:uncharacterized lipoprotein YajG